MQNIHIFSCGDERHRLHFNMAAMRRYHADHGAHLIDDFFALLERSNDVILMSRLLSAGLGYSQEQMDAVIDGIGYAAAYHHLVAAMVLVLPKNDPAAPEPNEQPPSGKSQPKAA